MKTPIPRSALEHHIAFVGKTGSGKTGSTKSGIIEPALAAGERVCVIDPTGAWWGLRLAADGKKPGFPIYVFGGDHGDFPLLASQGEMVAAAIGETSTPAILDTTNLRTGERMRFFTDFADAILRVNRGPLRLVIDEAHLFAPQAGTRGAGAMPDMLHAANNLISLGRSRGLRVVLISQRPAKVHKDSLTQVETLVAMRLIAPQDRKAIEEWIADQADKEKGKEIIASLPTLKTGEAWVWAPEADFLKRVIFPMPSTYDSSKVQAAGSKKRLSPIDVEKLQAQFARVKDEAAARDPAALQKRVRELEAENRRLQAAPAAKPVVDADAIAAAEARGMRRGLAEAEAAYRNFAKVMGGIQRVVTGAAAAIEDGTIAVVGLVERAIMKSGQPAPADKPRPVSDKRKLIVVKNTPTEFKAYVPPAGDGTLTPGKQKIIDAIAWAASLGKASVPKDMVAFLAGVSPTSSGYQNNLGALRSAGLIEYPAGGEVALTADGAAIAVPPANAPTHEAIMGKIAAKLAPAQMRILSATANAYPDDLSKEDLAQMVEASPTSSGYQNNLGRLRTLGFITYPSSGRVRAGESLFP